jgi:hypothetical protein
MQSSSGPARIGSSTRPRCACQSMSNQCAYADPGPSRSTDQNWRLSDSGAPMAMWLGTTSTMTPSPYRRKEATMSRNPPSPPRRADSREWSTTS